MTASVSVTEALAEMRLHRRHLQLQVNTIDVLGLALSRDLLSPEQVADWLARFDIGTAYRTEFERIYSEWRANDLARSHKLRRAA